MTATIKMTSSHAPDQETLFVDVDEGKVNNRFIITVKGGTPGRVDAWRMRDALAYILGENLETLKDELFYELSE